MYCSTQHDVLCDLCEQAEQPHITGELERKLHTAHEEIAKLQNDLAISRNKTYTLHQYLNEEEKHHQVSQASFSSI
jgi:hypothetical protein